MTDSCCTPLDICLVSLVSAIAALIWCLKLEYQTRNKLTLEKKK
jgi:hypothetical protein